VRREAAKAYADRVFQAARTRVPSPALTSEWPDLTAADAYAVQSELVVENWPACCGPTTWSDRSRTWMPNVT